MTILGIETSCDDTAAAVVRDDKLPTVLSSVVSSQIDIQKQYGGVVPEVASRSHLEAILPTIAESLCRAFPDQNIVKSSLELLDFRHSVWKKIDAIAVTMGPGLSGSLLMGTLSARTLATIIDKPIIPVHHIIGHASAQWLKTGKSPKFPCLALIVSGGHSNIMLFKSASDFQLLGQTRDDAVGEAFDKVAKMLGLAYPGGPSITRAAKYGSPTAFKLPIPKVDSPYDFSFSGLKTAVLRSLQKAICKDYTFPSHQLAAKLSQEQINDMAASFQMTAVKILIKKMQKAEREFAPESVIIGGGVAANQLLREEMANNISGSVQFIDAHYCTDNAAMIAAAALSLKISPTSEETIIIQPNWSLKTS
ncbi:tRNA (adenosine(37)-N6)-threonylcarbamoyltransferase complex transferase subunit TsaD [Candidatus Saccharibacteria bacterium]|nr:tRNA (adenosine(37)-N6)-threonylcarbamoyltransferase complex transferase subunit TsaD [Candidatus Saccharibacteria bacterium]